MKKIFKLLLLIVMFQNNHVFSASTSSAQPQESAAVSALQPTQEAIKLFKSGIYNFNLNEIISALDQGVNVNYIVDDKGNTALNFLAGDQRMIYVTPTPRENIVLELIKRGANLDTIDIYGRTPLLNSVFANRPAIAKILLEAGADINIKYDDENYGKNLGFLDIINKFSLSSDKKKWLDLYENYKKQVVSNIEEAIPSMPTDLAKIISEQTN